MHAGPIPTSTLSINDLKPNAFASSISSSNQAYPSYASNYSNPPLLNQRPPPVSNVASTFSSNPPPRPPSYDEIMHSSTPMHSSHSSSQSINNTNVSHGATPTYQKPNNNNMQNTTSTLLVASTQPPSIPPPHQGPVRQSSQSAMKLPPLPTSYPELKNLTETQLQRLLKDDASINVSFAFMSFLKSYLSRFIYMHYLCCILLYGHVLWFNDDRLMPTRTLLWNQCESLEMIYVNRITLRLYLLWSR